VSIIQGFTVPFTVTKCHILISRFATFASLYAHSRVQFVRRQPADAVAARVARAAEPQRHAARQHAAHAERRRRGPPCPRKPRWAPAPAGAVAVRQLPIRRWEYVLHPTPLSITSLNGNTVRRGPPCPRKPRWAPAPAGAVAVRQLPIHRWEYVLHPTPTDSPPPPPTGFNPRAVATWALCDDGGPASAAHTPCAPGCAVAQVGRMSHERVDQVDSHGRWKGPCLQTNPQCDPVSQNQLHHVDESTPTAPHCL
jgi:hypothetical protein